MCFDVVRYIFLAANMYRYTNIYTSHFASVNVGDERNGRNMHCNPESCVCLCGYVHGCVSGWVGVLFSVDVSVYVCV